MYIQVNANENLDKTVAELLKADIGINVRRYTCTAFITINLREFGYGSYLDVQRKVLRIYSFNTSHEILINLEDILTIYELN